MAVKLSAAAAGLQANAAALAAASGGTLVTADVQALASVVLLLSQNTTLAQQVLQQAGTAGIQQLLFG